MKKHHIIGIDARFYGEAGPGRYVKNILENLEKLDIKNKYIIFLTKKNYDMYIPSAGNFEKVLADYKWYTWSEQLGFLFKVIKQKLDLFYVPHFNIPVLYPKKLAAAIPDIIMHSFSTEKGTTLPKFYFKFKKLIYKFVVYWAVLRSKKVIIPSKDAINDFKKAFPKIKESKYVLAYEGVDLDFKNGQNILSSVLEKYNIKKPFLLYVSSMYEHKNVPRLIEAFKNLRKTYSFPGQLVLIGKKDKFSEDIQKLVKDENLENKVLMPGMKSYVPDEDVLALRKEARAYVFPSLKEGFSLTPLEAQAVGLPCAISDIACHREIYGDSVLYFDPHDTSDMTEKINEIITNENLRNKLISKGKDLQSKYSWQNTAKITLDVFNQILEGI